MTGPEPTAEEIEKMEREFYHPIIARLERALAEARGGIGQEAECSVCGDVIMVPADEDPNDTLCVPCADARDSGDEGDE